MADPFSLNRAQRVWLGTFLASDKAGAREAKQIRRCRRALGFYDVPDLDAIEQQVDCPRCFQQQRYREYLDEPADFAVQLDQADFDYVYDRLMVKSEGKLNMQHVDLIDPVAEALEQAKIGKKSE